MGADRDTVLRLRLYVESGSPAAARVEHNLRVLCDGAALDYELEVLDVTRHAQRAEDDRLLLTPTLIRLWPPPTLRVAGDLSDAEAALDGLGLRLWQRERARRSGGTP